jgi:hypothetical protein
MSILQKNNLTLDAYLDLKTGEIKGHGLKPGTRFLIIGSGAPNVGNVKKMMDQAKALNIPIVDSRRFLALIGVKLPPNPATPMYSNVTLGGEGSLNKGDPEAAPPAVPKVDEKKDEPKKDNN